jgi:hypothetical protein
MDSHDVRDPDDLIDEVARAMTSTELARDLRPAVAWRLASPAPWTLFGQAGWRGGVAATAVAAVVAVAVVMRPTPEPQRPPTVADASAERATVATPVDSGPETAPAAPEHQASRRVARQTILDTKIAEVVDISPVAIVPLEGDDEEDVVLTSSHVVEIAPIDVEPVSISGFELVE